MSVYDINLNMILNQILFNFIGYPKHKMVQNDVSVVQNQTLHIRQAMSDVITNFIPFWNEKSSEFD